MVWFHNTARNFELLWHCIGMNTYGFGERFSGRRKKKKQSPEITIDIVKILTLNFPLRQKRSVNIVEISY